MSVDSHNNESPEKAASIIEVARKRLTLYGFEKTTMHEIAADAGLSKASIYYYFPDKEHLVKAVIEKEQADYFDKLNHSLENAGDSEDQLQLYIKLRHEYFRNLLSLNKMRFSDLQHMKPFFKETLRNFKQKESAIVENILRHGIESGIFYPGDVQKTALLFLDILHGLRFVSVQGKEFIQLTEEDYFSISQKQSEFLDLFIRGLKNNKI
jgi:AcrR family transcriptional regulator